MRTRYPNQVGYVFLRNEDAIFSSGCALSSKVLRQLEAGELESAILAVGRATIVTLNTDAVTSTEMIQDTAEVSPFVAEPSALRDHPPRPSWRSVQVQPSMKLPQAIIHDKHSCIRVPATTRIIQSLSTVAVPLTFLQHKIAALKLDPDRIISRNTVPLATPT